jgi:putative protease
VVFIAQHFDGQNPTYPVDEATAIVRMPATAVANSDYYDLFGYVDTVNEFKGFNDKSITLTRKVAQMNFSTTPEDLDAAATAGKTPTHSAVIIGGVPAQMSMLDGNLSDNTINVAFEKEIEKNPCRRELLVNVTLDCRKADAIGVSATSEDSREVFLEVEHGGQIAENRERMEGMFASQIGKSAGHYRFHLSELMSDGPLPFMSAAALNGIRRSLAEELDKQSCIKKEILYRQSGSNPLMRKSPDGDSPLPFGEVTYKQNVANKLSAQIYREAGADISEQTFEATQAGHASLAYELTHHPDAELMRTKYCIRHELGICPVHQKGLGQNLPKPLQGIKPNTPLFLLNNGRRLALHFDCANCEMTITTP